MKIEDFVTKQPILRPEIYFVGESFGCGMFHDRFGNLRRQFTVTMTGEPQYRALGLREDFVFDDGEREQRLWQIDVLEDDQYEGVANDSVGKARGAVAGNAFRWQYQLNLRVRNGLWKVGFDDWMFLQPNGAILSRTTLSRWGIEIGVLTASFSKVSANAASGLQAQSATKAAE